MPFTITGTDPAGFRKGTRVKPASAIVLAMSWAESGMRDVQISPPDEEPRCFRVFQMQHFGASLPALAGYQSQPRPH